MNKFVCIKEFEVSTFDEDGFETDDTMTVGKGSVWTLDETNCRIIGGEVRLEDDDAQWIELSTESFRESFREAQDETE